MTSSAAPLSAVCNFFESIWEPLVSFRNRQVTPRDSLEDLRNRREFIHEMLNRNPDAFASDLDVQNMMQMYPGSF